MVDGIVRVNVTTGNDDDQAMQAAGNFASTLDAVWIVRNFSVAYIGEDVHEITAEVTAPSIEFTSDARIIKEAMGFTGLPTDALRLNVK